MSEERRSAIKKIFASVIGITGLGMISKANASENKSASGLVADQEIPLFSSSVKYGDLVFIAGKGAHFEGDIKAHTEFVLNDLEQELIKAGSSMDKVLKVNVYLADLNDYKAMNEVYRGRFGKVPPVRTTVAVYGGVPGNSLVEIDCIAHL